MTTPTTPSQYRCEYSSTVERDPEENMAKA